MVDSFRGTPGQGDRGQGRGGRRGSPPSSGLPTTAHRPSVGVYKKTRRIRLERRAQSLVIANAFDVSCAHLSQCRSKGSLFLLPPPTPAAQRCFLVVERNISGSDDVLYSQHRDVWECLPRGNARVYIKTDSSKGTGGYTLVGAVNGLRKFGDKDSTYGYPDAVQTVIAMETGSSVCGHLSAFALPLAKRGETSVDADTSRDAAEVEDTSRRFWVIGSKDVHIVLDYAVSEECLHYYSSLGCRYSHAIKISRLWKAMLPGGAELSSANSDASAAVSPMLTPAQARALHDALHKEMWTSCFEVTFSDSTPLMEDSGVNKLRFYAVTLNKRAFKEACTGHPALSGNKAKERGNGDSLEETADAPNKAPQYSRQDGLCIPVADAEAFYASVGLPFSHYGSSVVYSSPEYVQLVDTIRRSVNSEGCVMYGADASGKVVRLWTEKSHPYVMERITREAITNHKLTSNELQALLKKKLDHQPPELRDYFKDWEMHRMPWLLHFAAWLQMTRRLTPHMQRNELFQQRSRWHSLQKEFQTAADSDPKLYSECEQYQHDPVEWDSGTQDLDVIKFVGSQGHGKSTLGRALYALLQKAQYGPCWVNQNELGNRKKFLASLHEAAKAGSKVTHLIIDKMNLDAEMNHDYDNLPLSLTVTWFHPDGEKGLHSVCVDRVLSHGSCHRYLRVDPKLAPKERQAQVKIIRRLVHRALKACEMPKDPPELVLELDITTPINDMLRRIWEKLEDNGTHTLPPVTDKDISEAIDLSHQYESFLGKLPRHPIYACISIQQQEDVARLLSVVPQEFTAGQVVQRAFHLTTKYFGGVMDPVAFVQLAKLLGQSVTLTLESVVADPDGVAVTVFRDDARYPCANPIPHITISNRKGVPPKYSNDLISPTDYPGDPAKRKVVQVQPNCTISGVFEFR